ncbi:thermonuclease family protein [Priestia megaterium]
METIFYAFIVNRVIDGDTFEGTLEIPVKPLNAVLQIFDQRVRVHGVDTPEKNENFYKEAKEFTAQKVEGQKVNLFILEKDSFGRFVSDVYIDGETETLNQLLIKENLAVEWKRGHGNKLQREV